MLQRLRRSAHGGPSQTLMAELEHVTVDGRRPATEREWRLVETRLELQAAAAALREQWVALDAYVAGVPRLPGGAPNAVAASTSGAAACTGASACGASASAALAAARSAMGPAGSPLSLQSEPVLLGALLRERHVPRLSACVAAAAAAAGVSEQWSRALQESGGSVATDAADAECGAASSNGASAAGASSLSGSASFQQRLVVWRSSADCADALRRLDTALELYGEEICTAERERRTVLEQLDRAIAASGGAAGGGYGGGGAGLSAFAAALSAAASATSSGGARCGNPSALGASYASDASEDAAAAALNTCHAAAAAAAPPPLAPLAELRLAVAALGGLDQPADAAARAVLAARARLLAARAALAHVAVLRALAKKLDAPAWAARLLKPDPPPVAPPPPPEGSAAAALPAAHPSRRPVELDACPPDARRLWAAAAAAAALQAAEARGTRAARAAGGAAQRLMLEREAAVCALVAAAAKQALRAAMSPETCAGLMRLVSAVSQSGGASADSARSARYRCDLAAALTDCASSVPCWIMPTWRVSQCLPAAVRSFDLVVIDEASQSNVAAILPLLRGTRVLVVGDQKQVCV